MVSRIILPLAILGLTACVNSTELSFGAPIRATHYVSVPELLGNPERYNGEPVQVVGVAVLEFSYDGQTGIYSSTEDWEKKSYSYIFFELPDSFEGYENEAAQLDGRWVVVTGIFRAMEWEPLPKRDESPLSSHENTLDEEAVDFFTICKGICGAPGFVEVSSIDEW